MFRTRLAVVAVVAVVAAFGAQIAAAQAGYGQHDPWFGYAVSYSNPAFVTDTLAPGRVSAPVHGYRLVTDTLAPGGGTSSVPTPAARGFNWGDAGIGVAGTVGLALVLLGCRRAMASRHPTLAA
jgi:hypothetical protein